MDLKKKNIIIIAAGLLLAGVIAYIAVRTLGTPAAAGLYYKAESRNFERIAHWMEQQHDAFTESQKPYMDKNHRLRTELTASVGSGGKAFGLAADGRMMELIEKCKLVADTRRQPQTGVSQTDLSLLLQKVPFIDAKIHSDKETIYFTVPVLMPGKYFSADIGRLDEVYDKFSIPIKPKKLVNSADIAGNIEFKAETFRNSAGKLGDIVKKYVTADKVKYGQDKDVTVSGQAFRGREVLVSLDEEAATAMLHELADVISQDDALLSYTYGNFTRLSTLADDAGLFGFLSFMDETGAAAMNKFEEELLKGLNVREDRERFSKSLKETIGGYRLKNGLQMALVIDRDENILERKLSLDVQSISGDKGFVLDIGTGSTNNSFDDPRNRYADVVITAKPAADASQADAAEEGGNGADGVTELHIRPEFTKTGVQGGKGSLDISLAFTPQGGAGTGIDVKLDITGGRDELTLKKNTSVKFQANITGETGDGTLEGEWSESAWENKKFDSRNSTAELSFSADLPFLGISNFSGVLNIASEDRFGTEPVTLPDISQSEVTALDDVTKSDIDRIEMEILASFGTFYLSNKAIFDAFLGQ